MRGVSIEHGKNKNLCYNISKCCFYPDGSWAKYSILYDPTTTNEHVHTLLHNREGQPPAGFAIVYHDQYVQI